MLNYRNSSLMSGTPPGCHGIWYVPGRWVTKSPGNIGYIIWMWKESCIMSERIKLITEYLSEDCGISELALEYQVSRKTVYKWIARYQSGGREWLKDESRAAQHYPHAVTAAWGSGRT